MKVMMRQDFKTENFCVNKEQLPEKNLEQIEIMLGTGKQLYIKY